MRLPRLIGVARMMDMMLTGRTYSAEEGQAMGLSTYLVDQGKGFAKGLELAQRIASNTPLTNFAVTHVLPRIAESDPSAGFAMEALISSIAQADDEAKTRLKAFLEKRAPEGDAHLIVRMPVTALARETKKKSAAAAGEARADRRRASSARADGTILIRVEGAARRLSGDLDCDSLERWAKEAPDRVFIAQRGADGEWRKLTYAQVLDKVRRIAAGLLTRKLSRRAADRRCCPATASSTHCWRWARCMSAFPMRRCRRPIR